MGIGICASELRMSVVRPTLRYMGMWSQAKENLLLGTAAAESSLGFHLKMEQHQYLGIYQISPRRHKIIWENYLVSLPSTASVVRGLASQRVFLNYPHKELATNLSYATCIAWMIYRHCHAYIPDDKSTDILYMAKLWCKYFHKGRDKKADYFYTKYCEYILKTTTS